MSKKSSTCLFIIGNGFDIANGLKTSYDDFSNYIIEEIINDKEYSYFKKENEIERNIRNIIKPIIQKIDNGNYKIDDFKKDITNSNFSIRAASFTHNIFLFKLLSNSYENWFDIEKAYYSEIVKSYNEELGHIPIGILNENFESIKQLLKKYLKKVLDEYQNPLDTEFKFEQSVKDIIQGYSNYLVIDFNYTMMMKKIINSPSFNFDKNINDEIHYYLIHGSLENDIIFGWGDDTSTEYKNIRENASYEYFNNFKTINYLMNNTYQKLFNDLESYQDYDIHILGHSLGKCDKTLLKNIFKKEKVNYIYLKKILDFKDDKLRLKEEYRKLIINLTRITEDEDFVRLKTHTFDVADFFPNIGSYTVNSYNTGN